MIKEFFEADHIVWMDYGCCGAKIAHYKPVEIEKWSETGLKQPEMCVHSWNYWATQPVSGYGCGYLVVWAYCSAIKTFFVANHEKKT
jgi:hypothetical protein